MGFIFRVLLVVYTFCLAVVSAVFLIITFEHSILDSIYYYLSDTVFKNTYATLIMLAIVLVFFVLSVVFFLSGFKTGKEKKAVTKKTEVGEISISLDTIESIALSAARKMPGIVGTRASVSKLDNEVSITVKTNVIQDVNIPSLSEQMQNEVREAVESSSGITVRDVRIIIDNISNNDGHKVGAVIKQ